MGERWRIVVGSDHAGLAYKDVLGADMEADPRVAQVIDVGVRADNFSPYRSVAAAAVRELTQGRADRALLICGAGLGVAMSVNRVPGIRAVTASDSSSVERSVVEDGARVLCFGHLVIGIELARRLAGEWLGYRFDCGSATNVAVIGSYRENADSGHRDESRPRHREFKKFAIVDERPADVPGSAGGGRLRLLPAAVGRTIPYHDSGLRRPG